MAESRHGDNPIDATCVKLLPANTTNKPQGLKREEATWRRSTPGSSYGPREGSACRVLFSPWSGSQERFGWALSFAALTKAFPGGLPMAQQEWYLIQNGQEEGPLSTQKLKELAASGKISATSQIRRADMAVPIIAGKVKGLLPVSPMAAEAKPVDAALSEPAAPVESIWQRPAIIAATIVFFFPVALFLIWRHPSWTQSRKWAWTGAMAIVVACLAVFSKLNPPPPPQPAAVAAKSLEPKVVAAANLSPEEKLKSAKWDDVVSSITMFNEFGSNEVAASAKYTGKTVMVEGTVFSVEKGQFLSADKIILTGPFEQQGVRCAVSGGNADELKKVRSGSWVRLQGTCNGKAPSGIVEMSGCVFVIVNR